MIYQITPLRKGESKLTCMGMLIVTTREERRQVGLAQDSSSY